MFKLFGPRLCCRVLILLLVCGVLPQSAQRVAAGQAGLSASPAALAVAVPLGERRTLTVQLTNASNHPIQPLVYEALPAPAPAAARTGVLRAAIPVQAERIDPAVATKTAAAPDGRTELIVYLHDQVDLRAAESISDWSARGAWVYQTLHDHAVRSQAPLLDILQRRRLTARSFWVVNALEVHGTLADAEAIAANPEVALIQVAHVISLPDRGATPAQGQDTCSPDQPGNPICWNIRAIGAERVWQEFGVTGKGITVATNDTGAAFEHPALVESYRGYRGPGLFDHSYSWFDPQGVAAAPTDRAGHGTHVLGTIVGAGDPAGGRRSIGVAPGARWIAAQGCDGQYCDSGDLIVAAQWLLAPTDQEGLNPRPDLRPMIINNSWAGSSGQQWFAPYLAAWRAAGIFPVFAAGNAGRGQSVPCGSIGAPGDSPDVISVGAVDGTSAVAPFSLIGPTVDGRVKPDLVAPGTYTPSSVGIYSTGITEEAPYQLLQGTSMATPHVVGVVALLWSANPALIGDYAATYALLTGTAQRRPDLRCSPEGAVPNNGAGYGLVDAFQAVASAQVDLPWLSIDPVQEIQMQQSAQLSITIAGDVLPGPGAYRARLAIYPGDLAQPPATVEVIVTATDDGSTVAVTGRVTAADTGGPLAATVRVGDGPGVATDSDGRYRIRLRSGIYQLSAGALSYRPASFQLALSNQPAVLDIALEPDQPRLEANLATSEVALAFSQSRPITLTLVNRGVQPLHYEVSIPSSTYAIHRSDQAGGPEPGLLAIPASAVAVILKEDEPTPVSLGINFPFYGHVFTETLVGQKGILGFSAPLPGRIIESSCLPDNSTLFYVIAPFRANLDLSKGQIRSAILERGQRTLLSFEHIPLHGDSSGATYSYQVILGKNGEIEFRYGELGPLPAQLSVGIQQYPLSVQQIGCGVTTPIAPGLAIEFLPQPLSQQWLTIQAEQARGALAPGEIRQLELGLSWTRPALWKYQGHVLLTSSDPFRQRTLFTIDVIPQSAAYEVVLPHVVWNKT